jgi:hypothetical protein
LLTLAFFVGILEELPGGMGVSVGVLVVIFIIVMFIS